MDELAAAAEVDAIATLGADEDVPMLDVTTATVSTANVPQAASSVKGTQDDLMRIRVSHLRAGERGPLVSCHRMPPSLGWAAGTGGEWMAGHDAAVRGLSRSLEHRCARLYPSGCARTWQST